MIRMKLDEYKSLHVDRPPKYRNRRTERALANGRKLKFASQKEAVRYDELALMLEAGEIRSLRIHPEYTLTEAYTTPEGERVGRSWYAADFEYWVIDAADPLRARRVVEDCKGGEATKTQAYRLKRKLMLDIHGISVREV